MAKLIKLQHERDRGPGEIVLVNGVKYELDEEGIIELPKDAAAKLQAGRKWRPVEYWDARRHKIAVATPPVVSGGARRVRSRNELIAMADVNGIPMEDAEAALDESKPIGDKDAVAKSAAVDAETQAAAELVGADTIEVSDQMTKSELLTLGRDLGLKVNQQMSKADILSTFEAAQ